LHMCIWIQILFWNQYNKKFELMLTRRAKA